VIDFEPAPETRALLERVQAVLDQDLLPAEPRLLGAPFYAVEPELARLRDRVRAAGLWAPQAPKEVGGLGLPLLDHALVSERLGTTSYGHYVFGAQAPDAGNLEILHRHATPVQRERFLMPLARGEVRSCFAMTEPDTPGSNPTLLACAARRDADGYVLEGRKWFASGADGSAFAIVVAVTDPEAHPHRRATLFIVPTDTPGYRLVRNVPVLGHAGEGWMSHGELRFEGCRVPESLRLGAEGAGFAIGQERLGPGRIHHCMRWIGICERAFDLMCRRAATRRVDEKETLGRKALVQAFISESRARIDGARLLVLQTAWRLDRHGFEAAAADVSLCKFHVAEVMSEVVDRAVQVHGALGLTSDTPLGFFWAFERAAHIYDGPDEVHKLAAARRILKRYEDPPR
jgi:alkylation response protein AidB-like acyl-CoA dehydrogenase